MVLKQILGIVVSCVASVAINLGQNLRETERVSVPFQWLRNLLQTCTLPGGRRVGDRVFTLGTIANTVAISLAPVGVLMPLETVQQLTNAVFHDNSYQKKWAAVAVIAATVCAVFGPRNHVYWKHDTTYVVDTEGTVTKDGTSVVAERADAVVSLEDGQTLLVPAEVTADVIVYDSRAYTRMTVADVRAYKYERGGLWTYGSIAALGAMMVASGVLFLWKVRPHLPYTTLECTEGIVKHTPTTRMDNLGKIGFAITSAAWGAALVVHSSALTPGIATHDGRIVDPDLFATPDLYLTLVGAAVWVYAQNGIVAGNRTLFGDNTLPLMQGSFIVTAALYGAFMNREATMAVNLPAYLSGLAVVATASLAMAQTPSRSLQSVSTLG
jgi:hypothetical protein